MARKAATRPRMPVEPRGASMAPALGGSDDEASESLLESESELPLSLEPEDDAVGVTVVSKVAEPEVTVLTTSEVAGALLAPLPVGLAVGATVAEK